jgi:hypothetical protein
VTWISSLLYIVHSRPSTSLVLHMLRFRCWLSARDIFFFFGCAELRYAINRPFSFRERSCLERFAITRPALRWIIFTDVASIICAVRSARILEMNTSPFSGRWTAFDVQLGPTYFVQNSFHVWNFLTRLRLKVARRQYGSSDAECFVSLGHC